MLEKMRQIIAEQLNCDEETIDMETSFKDDLGMKDSNFLTKMVFPIGLGDGGGFIDLG